jgi:predicted MPP superfamily phosphohydrolase
MTAVQPRGRLNVFHLFTGVAALYLIWRLVFRLQFNRPVKWSLAILTLAASQHHLVTRNFFGSMASPEIPAPIIMVLGWAFGSLLLTFGLIVIIDVLGLLVRFIKRSSNPLLDCSRLRGAAAIAAMVLAVIGVKEATRIPDVKTVHITLPALPQALDGFRLVQLTDLHASRLLQHDWMAQVVAKTNALQPDLTVITGDLVDGTVAARANDVAPLRELTARLGVFSIVGNHEYYTEYQPWVTHLNGLGLRLLLNEHVTITDNNASFVLAGITDRSAYDFGQLPPDTAKALAGVAPEAVTILLSHRPTGAKYNAEAGADMQLSGHTHGGQVLGMHFVTQMANEGYVSGLYDINGMELYVSNGAGLWNGFPIRLGRRSEITEFVLHSSKQ